MKLFVNVYNDRKMFIYMVTKMFLNWLKAWTRFANVFGHLNPQITLEKVVLEEWDSVELTFKIQYYKHKNTLHRITFSAILPVEINLGHL